MNKYLKSASERYSKFIDKDFLIHPMSEIDCEISIELGQIMKKAGLDDVVEIFRSFKELKDEEIRDQLLQWNIDNPSIKRVNVVKKDSQPEEDEEEFPKPVFFQIGDIMIHEYDLRGIKLYERYEKEDLVYGLILNPTPDHHKLTKVPMYADHKIEYLSEENRNVVLENLSAYLRDKGIDIIDLEINE